MTDKEQLKRVARAICSVTEGDDTNWEIYVFQAQAAIDAMDIDTFRDENELLSAALLNPPIDIYDAAKGFLIFMSIWPHEALTFENLNNHMVKYGDEYPKWLENRTGYITKSEQAEIIYRLCAEKTLTAIKQKVKVGNDL